jgi:hypothetical protein
MQNKTLHAVQLPNFFKQHLSLFKECRAKGWKNANPCLDQIYATSSASYTISRLLSDLDRARAIDPLFEQECHGMTHSVGREAYRRKNQIHEAMATCDDTCGQGCIHGVMEGAFFKDNADGTFKHLTPKQIRAKLQDFCEKTLLPGSTQENTFKCYHGLGHAVMYIYQELPPSLAACDTVEHPYAVHSCKSGVFMENATGFNTDKNYFKRTGDYLFPCSIVADKDKDVCYSMHVNNMLRQGLSFEQVPPECKKAGTHGHACMGSLGMEMSYIVKMGKYERPRHVCEDLAAPYTDSCITNLAGSAISTGDYGRQKMYGFCSAFHGEINSRTCYRIIQSISTSYMGHDPKKIYAECQKLAPHTDRCVP